MGYDRRSLIRMTGVAAVGAATGCIGGETNAKNNSDPEEEPSQEGGGGDDVEETAGGGPENEKDIGPETAVAAGWNRMRSRLYDPVALASAGATDAAAESAQTVFGRFEEAGGEYGVHEMLEETDEEAYEGFEDALGALRQAVEDGDVETALEEAGRADEHLAAVQRVHLSENDAYALDLLALATTVGDTRIAEAAGGDGGEIGTSVLQRWETAEAHDHVEEADGEAYKTFEGAVSDVANGDTGGFGDALTAAVEGAYAVADNEEAVGTARFGTMAAQGYDAALVHDTGGDGSPVMNDVFGRFEQARVHEMVEEADEEAYEGFEGALDEYVGALEDGDGVRDSVGGYVDATVRASFAVAGASDESPVGESEGGGHGDGSELSGGPNVHEGEPDADHVVEMTAVAYEPETVEVSQGDTVAWVYAGGEPHTVTAYGDGIPDEADYWGSGDFSSEEAAREGWENSEGAVQDGEYYKRTFETTGTHEYFCIPHEAAGMVGEVVVE